MLFRLFQLSIWNIVRTYNAIISCKYNNFMVSCQIISMKKQEAMVK